MVINTFCHLSSEHHANIYALCPLRFSQVCCSIDAAQVCVGEGDGTTTRWEHTSFVSVADGDVTVTVPCDLASEFVVGVRLVRLWSYSNYARLQLYRQGFVSSQHTVFLSQNQIKLVLRN